MQLIATLFGKRQTNQAPRMTSHEVDDFGRRLFGRAHQVALVLAVLVVDDDDHAPFAYFSDGIFNGSKRHCASVSLRLLGIRTSVCYPKAPFFSTSLAEQA